VLLIHKGKAQRESSILLNSSQRRDLSLKAKLPFGKRNKGDQAIPALSRKECEPFLTPFSSKLGEGLGMRAMQN
jgi:hypothetical protein